MKKVAFLFPGQGAQYIGMSKKLCEMFPEASNTFDEASDVLGFDLKRLCFDGDIRELTKTENTQPAILTASVAAFRVFMKEIGVNPSYAAGHSLGEISALCCSGAIKFSDAVSLVRQRGKLMQEAVPLGMGGMAAANGLQQAEIEEVCRTISENNQLVVASNLNSKTQIVISGYAEAVRKAGDGLRKKGATVIPLRVSAPFHSPLMQPAADKFGEVLKGYSFSDFKWPVLSNVTAAPYENKDEIQSLLTKQIISPVRWLESMEYLDKNGVELAIEMGPKTVLKNLMKDCAPKMKTLSYDPDTDMDAVKSAFSNKAEKPYADGMKVLTKCIAMAVCTKNRNFNNDEYDKGVVENYRKLVSMKEGLVKVNEEPTVSQIKEALTLLRTIFVTKKVPDDEQRERFDEIIDETGIRGLVDSF